MNVSRAAVERGAKAITLSRRSKKGWERESTEKTGNFD